MEDIAVNNGRKNVFNYEINTFMHYSCFQGIHALSLSLQGGKKPVE